jgi:hypothetical protein
MENQNSTPTVVLPFLSARKLHDPFDKGIVTYEFRVDTRKVPDIQTDANARSPRAAQNRRVYQAVRDAALDGALKLDGEVVTPGLFGYKHLGINVIADRVEERDDRVAVLHFLPGQGVVNGGHGLEILRELQADAELAATMPPNFVKITVVTGLDSAVIPEIAGANNSSVQVKIQSLLELEKAFDPLKQALKGTRMENCIQWREGDPGSVNVTDIVAAMTCFRSDIFPPGERRTKLINTYSYKTGLLSDFRADQAGYHALAPRLPEILDFQDYIRTQPRQTYNEQGGKFGALKFVDSIYSDAKGVKRKKPLPHFEMPFSGEQGVEYRLNIAAVYPILAAFRRFIRKNKKSFEWTMPFEEIKRFWDAISVDVMETTREQCQNEGYNLNALGKSRPHWDAIERIVENSTLKRELEALRAR